MSEFIIYNGELYHHGVKGMKWGVRRFRKKDGSLTKAGERRYKSDEQYDALVESGQNAPTRRNMKKFNKQYAKYDKTVDRDIREAVKNGDVKAAHRIRAGRTFVKANIDSLFRQQVVADAAIQAKVDIGKDFSYEILRNDKAGGVDVKVNGKTYTYAYDTSTDRKRV